LALIQDDCRISAGDAEERERKERGNELHAFSFPDSSFRGVFILSNDF
jgi:hypothetical protein